MAGDLAIDPVCIPSEEFSWWKRHWREVVLYSVMGALIALSFLIPGAPAGACLLVKILVGVVTAAVSCFLISVASTVLAGILYGADMSNLWSDAGWAALWGAVGALLVFGVFATAAAIAGKIRAVNAAKATAAAKARGAMKPTARDPIFADNNFLVNAAESKDVSLRAKSLAEIRAGTTYVTPAQYDEFLAVTSAVQKQTRTNFLAAENITVYSNSSITNSAAYQKVYNTVYNAGHGVGDATLAAYASATGYTAVTAEKTLFNYLTKTQPQLGVPIRRIF